MEFERINWQIDDEEHQLVHAPWNPRAEITPESVKDLVASITAKGLLHDIGVWMDPESGNGFVIFGNRRFVACRTAGLAEIPCKIYHCSEAEARELTRIENEQRLGVSAIEDAKLVKSMLDLGFKETEIAAHFGVSNAMVCRRAKLIGLNEKYVKISSSMTTDALEQIALFPDDVQSRMFDYVKSFCRSGIVKWAYVRNRFQREIRNLPTAPFLNICGEAGRPDYGSAEWVKCGNCSKRTGCQPDLFGEITAGKEDGGGMMSLGHCLDAKCFAAMTDAWIGRELEKRIPAECEERVKVESYWLWHGDEWAKKRSKKNPCAYWRFDEYTNKLEVMFGPSRREIEEKRKAEAERAEADRKAEEKAREFESRILKVCEDWACSGIGDEDEDNGEDYLREGLVYLWQCLKGADLVKEALMRVFEFGLEFGESEDGISDVCEYDERTDLVRQLFLLADKKDVEKFVDLFIRLWGSSLRDRIGNRWEYERYSNAYNAACMFRSLKEKLTEDEIMFLREKHFEFTGKK